MENKEIRNDEKIVIAFYKGDIISDFQRETDGRKMAVIQFPKTSKYAGYVWYYPLEWIRSNERSKNERMNSINPDKRWIKVRPEFEFRCIKKILNEDTKKWEQIDEITLGSQELKERMKRSIKSLES